MNRRVASVALILCLAALGPAQGMPLLTVGEATYENVRLKKEYPRSLFIKHDGGTAFIDRGALSEEQLTALLDTANEPDAAVSAPTESAEQDYKRAKSLLKEEDDGENWTQAADLMRRAAEAGHRPAQYEWGVMLIDGFCVEQDSKNGEEFIKEAADAGNAQAMLQLAMWEKDPGKMSQGIRKAAEAGDGHAMVHVAAGFGMQPGDDRGDSRAWLDKAFATGNPEVIVHAASILQDQSQQERNAERLGMTKEEMQAKAIEVLRAGCKGNVPAAYRDLAIAFRRGSGVEKSEKESEELMEKFNRLEGQRAARGSVAARFNLMVALQVSGGEDDEVLRLAEEILERSNYVGHYTAAALFGARSVEGSDPQSAEGIQRGLDWLKKLQEEKNDDGIASLIANYESRLAKAARTSAGQ